MLFNSLEFAIFLPLVFAIYWSLQKNLRVQNLFVIIASYVFYGWWDWRFLLLIAFTSLCSWGSGLLIARDAQKDSEGLGGGRNVSFADKTHTSNITHYTSPKFWLWFNIAINLGILGVFKYYDFFVSEFGALFRVSTESLLLRIILPVGISFYTFQALSYSIDVYRKKIEPTKDIIAFYAFIAFFPQLVAGPIERATNLLPQFLQKRNFDYKQAAEGVHQIIWGLFKKMVVADCCAVYVNDVFESYTDFNASTLALAAILFSFQIYGDFSGYSDIAIGTAKLFGIRLMRNFNNPYFSRDIAEFWRRWHISLTTWFRDYVYIPLGGSRVEKKKIIRNTFVIFLVSGLWHGANWTFIAWGAYHAMLFLPLILLGTNRKFTNQVAEGSVFPSYGEMLRIVFTFMLVAIGWILFRSETILQAVDYMSRMVSVSMFSKPVWGDKWNLLVACVGITIMIITEWYERGFESPLQRTSTSGLLKNKLVRIISLSIFSFLMLMFRGGASDFIYFQF